MRTADRSLALSDLVNQLVQPDFLQRLTDTSRVDPARVSCIATALREARALVGRKQSDGDIDKPEHSMTWAGALVYLIYCEQIGSCFHPANHSHRRRPGSPVADALIWFGGLSVADAGVVEQLRNRLAHDYTLKDDDQAANEFALHGSHRTLVRVVGPSVRIGLPALAATIEDTFNPSLMHLATNGELLCHHKGGLEGIDGRFWMRVQ